MKKILIITLEYPPQIGGVATYVTNFAEYYKGADFIVYAPKISDHDESYDAARPWKVVRKKQLYTWWWPRWLKMIFQCYTLVKREKITDLHIHHVLPAGYIGWLFKRFFGLRYTIFFHGSDAVQGQKPEKINQLKAVLRDADQIIVNSVYLQNTIAGIAPRAPRAIVVHPCPSDIFISLTPDTLEIERVRDRLALQSKKVMLSVGRLVDGKGHRQLLEIFPRLLARFPNLIWIIVGTGPLEQAIVQRARELQVASALRFIGAVPAERLRLFYAIADIFVLLTHKTAQSTEAWGTVFLEAAASGLAVVAGSGGGVDEAVLHKKTGLVVDTDHPHEVIDSILTLLERPEYAAELGSAGRERVVSQFLWSEQLSKIV